jgi:hypothetical protein
VGSTLTKTVKARDRQAPSVPTNLTAVAISASEIRLECATALDSPETPNAAATGVAGYRWYSSPNGDTFAFLAQTSGRVYIHPELPAATTYWYRVSAIDGAGNQSDQSASVSATTGPATVENRAPVWSSAAITLNVYPGQVVSRQLTYGSIAFEPGKDCWDVDGDALEFSEAATGVLQLIGLSISSTGLISGTIPAGADAQTVSFRISVSDGQAAPVIKTNCSVQVLIEGDYEAEWIARTRAPGVFYATNFTELLKYALNNVGGPEREIIANAITSVSDFGTSSFNYGPTGMHVPTDNLINYGDGKGCVFLDTEERLSGDKSWAMRHVHRFAQSGELFVNPYQYAPLNYTLGFDGVLGLSNRRYGLGGQVLKYIETERGTGLVDSKGNLSTFNPDSNPRPVVRHCYIQWAMKVDASIIWGRQQPYLISSAQRTFYAPLAGNSSTQQNKFVFVTGGQTMDQVAITTDRKTGIIKFYLQGSGNDSPDKERTDSLAYRTWSTYGVRAQFQHTAINLGTPSVSTRISSEEMCRLFGPSFGILATGNGFTGAPRPEMPTDHRGHRLTMVGSNYLNSYELKQLGYGDGDEVDWTGHPWRQMPYGSFDLTSGKVFKDLSGMDQGQFAGVWNPTKWKVIEVLVTAQEDYPANDPALKTGVAGIYGYPLHAAVWAADYGEPPVLLAYTNSGDPQTLPYVPDHTLTDAGTVTGTQTSMVFKWQDANNEAYSGAGFMVVGPGVDARCMTPTATEFDIILHPRSQLGVGTLPYEPTTTKFRAEGMASSPGSFNPGTRDGWGCHCPIGFRSGTLTAGTYDPINPHTGALVPSSLQWGWGHGVIKETIYELEGRPGFTITDPYDGATRQVHRVRMKSALPVAPASGDCAVINFRMSYMGSDKIRNLPGHPEARLRYTELIYSFDPIPFPGHLSTPLAMPWRT